MKFFATVFLFIFFSVEHCFCQDPMGTIIHLNELPSQGVTLDKGWKFHPGDNPNYASPGFDDSKWENINPTLDIRDSLRQIPRSGICWFRLHLLMDSNLLNDQLALVIYQAGASEIYLNGELIKRLGVVSNEPFRVNAFNPNLRPIPFSVGGKTEVVLAVRYVLEPNAKYTSIRVSTNPAFSIVVNNLETAVDVWARVSTQFIVSCVFRVGLFFILAVLHLAFFVFYPAQKANLYLSLFAMLGVVGNVIETSWYGVFSSGNLNTLYYAANIVDDMWLLGYFVIVTAFYSLFNERKTWIYWALLCLVVVAGVLNTSYRLSWINVFITSSFFYAELMRITFKSVRKKMRGARILAAGVTCFLIFWLVFMLGVLANYKHLPFYYLNRHIGDTFIIGDVAYNLMYVSIPAATSIYLALDFAFTSQALKKKLAEVEDLSQKTIAQEKEKQQILSSVNETLEKQVAERTGELNRSLENLKSTQAQLIQSEKMASLGELTAGIAHEIQNPLNFVNNFSDVNTELIDELNDEAEKGNVEGVKAIAKDIKENEQKINHHGKRADSIVKGMLQHSRTSSGQKELTDINALCDEYLRLAYHGLRAKDKSFNVESKTDFDYAIGRINIVPQDIGRVILNLINNAFYAVSERQKVEGVGYEPKVVVTTKKLADKVLIYVADNGSGIPQRILDRIFQPFFTTKPTGQGTGLGLSLAYDIVRAHGGQIKVETKNGEGSEFIVQIGV